MMKRWMSTGMILAMAFGSGGCATVKKKFTRKSTAGPTRPVVYTEKEFIKPYTNEYYYNNNYNLWKVWHEELVKSATDSNGKHSARAGDEAVARLEEMQNYLEEPKKSELGEQISQIKLAADSIRMGASRSQAGQATFILNKTLRIIKASFYVDDIRPWLKKDEIKL